MSPGKPTGALWQPRAPYPTRPFPCLPPSSPTPDVDITHGAPDRRHPAHTLRAQRVINFYSRSAKVLFATVVVSRWFAFCRSRRRCVAVLAARLLLSRVPAGARQPAYHHPGDLGPSQTSRGYNIWPCCWQTRRSMTVFLGRKIKLFWGCTDMQNGVCLLFFRKVDS